MRNRVFVLCVLAFAGGGAEQALERIAYRSALQAQEPRRPPHVEVQQPKDAAEVDQPESRQVRDALWVWGNPEMSKPGEAAAARFANCSPSQRAKILGVPNVVLAGPGLPHDRKLAAEWTTDAGESDRLVWEIISDGHTEHEPPFEFKQRIADLAPLVTKNPQIEAVLLDDMSSVAATKGFRPEHLKDIKALLKQHKLPLKLWGVLYTMNFPNEHTDALVGELDVINLWHWHAKDTAQMEEHVAECERRYPGKPIVLGIYMYDYGGGRRIPRELHEQQCKTALGLLQKQRIEGIVFLSVTDDEESVQWTADWINRVAAQPIRKKLN